MTHNTNSADYIDHEFFVLVVASVDLSKEGKLLIGFRHGTTMHPEADGKLYVLPNDGGTEFSIPNDVLLYLKVNDVLAWKDKTSFEREQNELRVLMAADASARIL